MSTVVKEPQGIFIPLEKKIRHLIENGILVYTWVDFEATDKEWMNAEITMASLTIVDIGYNLISDDLFEVRVPDRVGLSPEAMLITRYIAHDLRQKNRLSPQQAAAMVFEAVQSAPRRLWDNLAHHRENLGEELYNNYVDEGEREIVLKSGEKSVIYVRHFPTRDEEGNVKKNVRVHRPVPLRSYMEMSYRVEGKEDYDYSDDFGRWKIKKIDKLNGGFRNTFFDIRLLAAALFRANFPQKEIYALNRKSLGSHSIDAFTLALTQHFFSKKGRERLRLGEKFEPEIQREKITARLDSLFEENSYLGDSDASIIDGMRVYDGSLFNIKRGHNAPDYDNAKAIGLHRFLREVDADLLSQTEKLAHIDVFRDFLTRDVELGQPTSHPLRFIVASSDDDTVYRAVPVIILGTDDEHQKFNRVWAVRADIDLSTYYIDGKSILDLNAEDIVAVMRAQKGRPDALFHEINLRRFRGVATLEQGLAAGHSPGISLNTFRYHRDQVVEYLDDSDRRFIDKALDAFAMRHPFQAQREMLPQPYVEEEIWTAMGDIKYPYVVDENGKTIKLPKLIREMAQDEFKRLNDRLGDPLRDLLRPQKFEWDPSLENALEYARKRRKVSDTIEKYQHDISSRDRIILPPPFYPDLASDKLATVLNLSDMLKTILRDKLYIMDVCPATTRRYEVQRRLEGNKASWQTIPFDHLAKMSEAEIIALKDEGKLRVIFDSNPNSPALRFTIRYFAENGIERLLTSRQREFYDAETAFYVAGLPYLKTPKEHRIMSAPRILESIESLRQNRLSQISSVSASRDDELGVADRFMKEDMAEAILRAVEADTLRRVKKHSLTDKRKFQFGINPQDNNPYLFAKYEIPDKNIVIKIPDGHVDKPSSHHEFGHLCVVVPFREKIAKARHIILEEEKSGRRFYAAQPVIFPLPPRNGAYEHFYRGVDKAYEEANAHISASAIVLSCAEIVPISKTKSPKNPAIHISQDSLMATRNPHQFFLSRDEPLRKFIVRKYDLKLKSEQRVRLRGVNKTGEETGWEVSARITEDPQIISLKEVLDKMADPNFYSSMDKLAFECGFHTADDLKAHILSLFTQFDEDITHPKNELYIFEVSDVKPITFWTPKAPLACFERKLEKRARKNPKTVSVLAKKELILKDERHIS
jgi:hypothetical protein